MAKKGRSEESRFGRREEERKGEAEGGGESTKRLRKMKIQILTCDDLNHVSLSHDTELNCSQPEERKERVGEKKKEGRKGELRPSGLGPRLQLSTSQPTAR